MDSWYAVHTRPNGEIKAAFNLQKQGFKVYLPSYHKLRRHARKVKQVLAPLFPRYLFIRMNINAEPWRAINSTIGVTRLVSDSNLPIMLPSAVIEDLRSREDANGVIQIDLTDQICPGDKVRIIDGVMTGTTGTFYGASDSERVQVLMEFLGRSVKTFVPKNVVGRFS